MFRWLISKWVSLLLGLGVVAGTTWILLQPPAPHWVTPYAAYFQQAETLTYIEWSEPANQQVHLINAVDQFQRQYARQGVPQLELAGLKSATLFKPQAAYGLTADPSAKSLTAKIAIKLKPGVSIQQLQSSLHGQLIQVKNGTMWLSSSKALVKPAAFSLAQSSDLTRAIAILPVHRQASLWINPTLFSRHLKSQPPTWLTPVQIMAWGADWQAQKKQLNLTGAFPLKLNEPVPGTAWIAPLFNHTHIEPTIIQSQPANSALLISTTYLGQWAKQSNVSNKLPVPNLAKGLLSETLQTQWQQALDGPLTISFQNANTWQVTLQNTPEAKAALQQTIELATQLLRLENSQTQINALQTVQTYKSPALPFSLGVLETPKTLQCGPLSSFNASGPSLAKTPAFQSLIHDLPLKEANVFYYVNSPAQQHLLPSSFRRKLSGVNASAGTLSLTLPATVVAKVNVSLSPKAKSLQ